MARDKDYNKLIHTERWLRLRKAVLTAHPMCQDCMERGMLSPAVEVHHVRPVEDGLSYAEKQQLMYDPSNLRALCHGCHVRVHTEMGRSGKAGAKRRAREQRARFVKKFLGNG